MSTKLLLPNETYLKCSDLADKKANQPWYKTFILALFAGIYISYGCVLALSVGGQLGPESSDGTQKLLFAAFGLPFGLTMVLVCGAELFTGNTLLMTVGVLEKRCSIKDLAKNWFISFIGNLLGSIFLILLVQASEIFDNQILATETAKAIASSKVSKSFFTTFTRGILCNWLVCLAVWQATAGQTFVDKTLGIFWPITAFVAIGFDHSVANMFLIPLGIFIKTEETISVTVGKFLAANLLPVTLGNIVAGALFVACGYSVAFGTIGKKLAKIEATKGVPAESLNLPEIGTN